MHYWLMKTEPNTFSIDDLIKKTKQQEPWNGVRNFQARNFMKEMKLKDKAFFYHSSCEVPGIVGIVEIVKEAYPDHTAFDPRSPYFDEKSKANNPRWYMVDVQFVEKFPEIIPLKRLKEAKPLQDMVILKPGNRLSITPVTSKEWHFILELKKEFERS